jgi:hypothetical protein
MNGQKIRKRLDMEHCPLPWKVSESTGGKWFMYDANGKPVVVPNASSTGRKPEELKAIYHLIVNAVNNEHAAWANFDKH